MTHQQTAVLISDPSSTAVTTDHMGEITERLIAGHEEVGIICVSGRRDEKKGILLNYITHYISWLSSDEGAGQDYRNMIFLQKWQALDGGVYMWPDPFLVRTENKMGIVDQKLPLLLIDASPEDGTSAAHICVHFMRTAVFSPGDIVNEINKMIIKWGDAKQDISDQMSAGTDGQDSLICLLRDWSTDVPALITEDWFSLPQHSLDVRYFLKSFVYHMFGNVCQSQHSDDILAKQRICRNVFYKSPDEHVVEGMVRVYLNRMRRHLSGPEVSIESLNTMHTKILKEVMEQLRNRNFPVQFKLRKKPILNKRLNEEFKFLSERYQCLMQQPKEFLDLQLQKQYIVAIQDALGGNGIDDHELLRIHTTEMRKVMSAFRTQCQASDQDLSERIAAAFRALKKLNAESRKQQEPVILDDLTGKFAQMFADDMTVYVKGLSVMDTKQAKRQQEVIYGRLLWKIDKSMKDMSIKPVDQKKQKKEIEQQVNKLSDEIIKKRDDELQVQAKRMDDLFMQYIKKMHHEMDSAPFMDREESDGKHEKVKNEILSQWQEEHSKHVLSNRLENEYPNLWQQLQEEKGKRPDRMHSLVTKLVACYKIEMSKEFLITQNKMKLDQKHSEKVNKFLSQYKGNKDVKEVGHHLPQIEEGLREQLNLSYDEIWREQQTKHQAAHDHAIVSVDALVDQLVLDYNVKMAAFCGNAKIGATSIIELTCEHETIQRSIMLTLRTDDRVKQVGRSHANHTESLLKEMMSKAFAGYKSKIESMVQEQVSAERQKLVERGFQNYVSGIADRFGVHPPVSLEQYTAVHTLLMDTEVEKLEMSHLLKSCPESHVHRSQLVQRIENENKNFQETMCLGREAGAAAAAAFSPSYTYGNEDDRRITEAVIDANSFYRFFMRYSLMNEKKHQLSIVDVYERSSRVQEESVINLELQMLDMSTQSLNGAKKQLLEKNDQDVAHFARLYVKQNHDTGYRDALVSMTTKLGNLLSFSDSKTFLDDITFHEIEKRMKQLYEVRLERFMREQRNASAHILSDVKYDISDAIILEMYQKKVSDVVIASVKRRFRILLSNFDQTAYHGRCSSKHAGSYV